MKSVFTLLLTCYWLSALFPSGLLMIELQAFPPADLRAKVPVPEYIAVNQLPHTALMIQHVHEAFVDQARRLDGDRHELRPAIESLRRNHAVALSHIGVLAEAFSVQALAEKSGLYQRAFGQFAAGQVSEALYILSDTELEHALREAYRHGWQPSEPEFKRPIDNYMLKARLSVLALEMETASGYYMKAIHTNRSDYSNLIEYARFLFKLGYGDRSLSFTERALEVAVNDTQRAWAWDLIANIHAFSGRYPEAADAYDRSREHMSDSGQKIPLVFMVDNAIALRKRAFNHNTK